MPAVASKKRVVVATATKALQDQLARKDLPLVARGLGRPVRWAVLKGRSNYLCRQRLDELERLGEQQQMEAPLAAPEAAESDEETHPSPAVGTKAPGSARVSAARRVGEEVRRLADWARSTGSGDRAELEFEPSPQAWSSVSVTADECPGARRCPSGASCFAEAARAKAASADIVIVNLHLLGAHLRTGGEVLPDHDALVIDEAHELEDILAASLGVEVSPGRLRALGAMARAALGSGGRRAQRGDDTAASRTVEAVMDAAGSFEDLLAEAEDQRLPAGLGSEIGAQVSIMIERLERLGAELRRVADGSGGQLGAGATPAGSDAAQRCLRALLGVDRCREELAACLAAGSDEVVWVSGGARPAMHSAPLDISQAMSAQVFSQMPVVMTSATHAAQPCRPHRRPERYDTRQLDVGSPFPYKRARASVLRRVASRPAQARGRGRHPRRDRGARARRRRADPCTFHQPAGP